MDSLLIKGGVPLQGEVEISGAKNAVLPILAATLLTGAPCVIRRVPNLSDVGYMGQILAWLGAKVEVSGDLRRLRLKVSGQPRLVLNGKTVTTRLAEGMLSFGDAW